MRRLRLLLAAVAVAAPAAAAAQPTGFDGAWNVTQRLTGRVCHLAFAR